MAGLSNFIANQATQETTMPSWYDQAQQNLVSGATTGASAVPALADTSAKYGIDLFKGDSNPFSQAQDTLQKISTGAANPWITSPTGQVTPNVSTPLGGLFQAQNQQLRQLAPDLMAVPTAAGTAAGQFGSLRTQTAANKALADAQSKLFADQMQAALQNQQTGSTAAANLGNVAEKGITAATSLGQVEQADPLLASSALGKILGSMQVPTAQKNVTQVSPLNQIGAIASALGGSVAGTNKLLSDLGIKGGLPELFKGITGGGSGLTPDQNPGGSGFNYGQDSATQGALNSGMSPVDDDGLTMPGWSQGANGTWIYSGTGGGGGGGDTGGGGGGFDIDWGSDTVDLGGGGGGLELGGNFGDDWGSDIVDLG